MQKTQIEERGRILNVRKSDVLQLLLPSIILARPTAPLAAVSTMCPLKMVKRNAEKGCKKENKVKNKIDDKMLYRIIWQQLGIRIAKLEIKSYQ